MSKRTANNGVKNNFEILYTNAFYRNYTKEYRAQVVKVNDSEPLLCLSKFVSKQLENGNTVWAPTAKNLYLVKNAIPLLYQELQRIMENFDSVESSMPMWYMCFLFLHLVT